MATGRVEPLLLTVCLVSACAAPGERLGEAPLLKGWAQGSGEIRIYGRQEDLGNFYDGTCISGVMSRGRMLSHAMSRRHVAVYGTWLSAGELYEMLLRGVSIGAENYCGGERLFIAERIIALD
jgi:hypothetical protein